MKPRQTLAEAIAQFSRQQESKAIETRRKYNRVLSFLKAYCDGQSIEFLDQISLVELDGYARHRAKTGWTWVKEVEILRYFFRFCVDREWTAKNYAALLERPKITEANDAVPYTQAEIVRMLAACNQIGRYAYERLRARAMVLVLRHTGMRIGDVVTLSREHIQGRYLVKKAIKNRRIVRIELQQTVLDALEMLPRPKAASADCQLYFGSEKSSVRSLVKGAERTLGVVFKRAEVEGAYAHRFRHTLASEILGAGGTIGDAARVLGDDPAIIQRHYAKWILAIQIRQDAILRAIHESTDLAQSEGLLKSC